MQGKPAFHDVRLHRHKHRRFITDKAGKAELLQLSICRGNRRVEPGVRYKRRMPSSTPYQALYRSCMKEAAAQGRTLMQRLVRRVALSIPTRAALVPDVQERQLLGEAARVLMKHEGALCEAYPQALLAEFAQAIAGDLRRGAALSFDSLELMGDEQVKESVELVRTQQAVQHAVEAELTELNALVCAVQGLKNVLAERNPLRPEVYVRSLRTVTLQSPVPPAMRARWMQHLGEALGPELAAAYRELSHMLRGQGVTEAGFVIAPSRESLTPRAGAQLAPPEPYQASTLLTVHALQRLVSGELDPQTQPAAAAPAQLSADFSVTVPAAFEALQEMRQVDAVMKRLQQRQGAGGIDPAGGPAALREALRQEAKRPGQVLGLEVVNLMVENIAGDARLLPPVQQAVRDLEPALLRLALGDPRFFSDKKHPARQLLEQMTQRSLQWQSTDAPGFAAFVQPLQEAVDALLSTRIAGAEPFDFALKSLEEAWGEEQQRSRRYREKAVRALLQAEQRNLLAGKIAKALRRRDDVMTAPPEILHFILGPWAQVMAQARLADATGEIDAGGWEAVIADLAWSVQPRTESGGAARLAKLLPTLLDRLRRGLNSIDYPETQTQRFFDELALLHQRALKPGLSEPARPIALSTRLSREELEAMLGSEEAEAGAWLQPTEAQHSGFMETHQSVVPQPLFQATQAGFGETRPQPDANELAPALPPAALQNGAWVELLLDGGWSRYQLTWSSPHGTLFMFTAAGSKTQSMTRRLLDKMLKTGTLKLVSGQAVVDGALDAVADAALRNSLDLKL